MCFNLGNSKKLESAVPRTRQKWSSSCLLSLVLLSLNEPPIGPNDEIRWREVKCFDHQGEPGHLWSNNTRHSRLMNFTLLDAHFQAKTNENVK
jgi:hypothetical protein